MTQLDAIFRHYIQALLSRAVVETTANGWQATLPGLPSLTGHENATDLITIALTAQIEDMIFARMRRGEQLPIVAGIDVNGGSC